MESLTNIIDPDGEVIIVLHTTDPYVAEVTNPDGDAEQQQKPPPAPAAPPETDENGIFERAISPVHASNGGSRKSKKLRKKHRVNRSVPAEPEPVSDPAPEPEPELVPTSQWGIHVETPPEPEPEPVAEPLFEPATEGSVDELYPVAEPAPEPIDEAEAGWIEEAPPVEPVDACWPDDEPPECPAPEDPVPEYPEKPVPEYPEETVREYPEEPAPEPEDAPAPALEPTQDAPGRILRIQVSAKHLSLASPVFRQGLRDNPKGEIHAEGWDILPFFIVLRIIHCQNSQLPLALPLPMLAKVAEIANHYQCKAAIGILQNIWIKALLEPDTTEFSRDLMLWLWIAFFFDLPDRFRQISSAVMSLSDGPIDPLGLPFPKELIGWDTRSAFSFPQNLTIHRQDAIRKVLHLIAETETAFLDNTRGCTFECSAIMHGALRKELHTAQLLSPVPTPPFSGLAYADLVYKVSMIRSPVWLTRLQVWRGASTVEEHRCSDSSFAGIFGYVNGRVPGLHLPGFLVE
ncbi:hypothetical protein BJY00DRAFT_313820 [Aspergillus carlsbadensis]|nr:hypothetical protein BJY00DRAFT_313820 [Aspergillus carlsbadensis]